MRCHCIAVLAACLLTPAVLAEGYTETKKVGDTEVTLRVVVAEPDASISSASPWVSKNYAALAAPCGGPAANERAGRGCLRASHRSRSLAYARGSE